MNQEAKVQLRLPGDLHAWVVQFAAKNDRSMNGQIVSILREVMQTQNKNQTAVASVVLGG